MEDYVFRQEHITSTSEILSRIDKELARILKSQKLFSEDYQILLSIPGFGPTFGAVVLLETGLITRFRKAANYSSYCCTVQCMGESAGKSLAVRGNKNGNPRLKWAFGEAARRAVNNKQMRFFYEELLRTHKKREAYAILRNKLCRCAWFMLKKKKKFDPISFYGEDNCRRYLKLNPDDLRESKLKNPNQGKSK
jgi:transposase